VLLCRGWWETVEEGEREDTEDAEKAGECVG
jgi:hypothetical protein